MPFLIRRINRGKWPASVTSKSDDVSADAITLCLKTSSNELSVWRINTEAELDDAILALITGSDQEKLSTLHYVVIDEDALISAGLSLKSTIGNTAIQSLTQLHRDIECLTYNKLGTVKSLILDCLQEGKAGLMAKKQLRDLFHKAISNNKISREKLNPKLIESEKL